MVMGCADKATEEWDDQIPDDAQNQQAIIDGDNDGYTQDEDCDDADPLIHPGATELCDGVDNDCDNEIDEGVTTTYYADVDLDGFGDLDETSQACDSPEGYVPFSNDCDDSNDGVYPGAPEICDGLDNDCDELIDEDEQGYWFSDEDGDGYGDPNAPLEYCDPNQEAVLNYSDCDDTDAAINPDADEVCDGVDNNCDTLVDEGWITMWYPDLDLDGFGDPLGLVESCEQPKGSITDGTDCDDTTAAVYPGAEEVCDTLDNDCDDAIDEGVTTGWYADTDGDGYGSAADFESGCEQPEGTSDVAGDCDDENDQVNPSAIEVCNSVDDDCDGNIDEANAADAPIWFFDNDGDGYGLTNMGVQSCDAPEGYVGPNDDCDDTNADIHPNAAEFCNDTDDDCDGNIDEDAVDATVWYGDADNDTYGGPTFVLTQCDQPNNYVDNNDDCNDTAGAVNPGAPEVCDGIDNNCDGAIDDLVVEIWYSDGDGDGFGDGDDIANACEAPDGYVDNHDDCDDDNDDINPNAQEVCNDIDDNCNGDIDEGVLGTDAMCPATDCSAILDNYPSATDGEYYLEPGIYYCDMTTCADGECGGWTLIGIDVPVWGTGYDQTYYNIEAFSWNSTLFEYSSGSVHAHCTYPEGMPGCNNLGFQFDTESWGVPLNWGSSICGMPIAYYESATTYINEIDFVIDRQTSEDTIRLGTLEGISNCTTNDNPGEASLNIFVRR